MAKAQIRPPTLRELVAVALPMIASQASETVMLFVDRLFLSWLGKVHIAASMSGGLSTFVFTSLFAGIVGYTNAIVAQYYGAERNDRCVEATVQGTYLSFALVPAAYLLIPLVQHFFVIVGHSAEQVRLESTYFGILMLSAPFVLLRQVFVGFFLGIGRTRIVMAANVVGMVINVPLNYVLIFGHMGFPALGIRGAAYGTIAGSGTILFILLIAFFRHQLYRSYAGTGRFKLRWDLIRRLVRFGLPAGTELFLNVFAFNLFVQLMHSMGEDVAAAVTITFNYDMVAFIPMVGLGVAVTSLVGRQMGGGNPEGARKATFLALRVGYSYASLMMVVFIAGAGPLVRVFAGALSAQDQELLNLAKAMLRLAAIYTLADITQLVFGGALRGAGDTRYVMYISVAMHWFMAIGAVVLIRVVEAPPLTVWLFFIGFVVLLGAAIFWRFQNGAWTRMKVIEEEQVISETHPPEVSTEAQWM
jgi:MATE family multidrug resistance protein